MNATRTLVMLVFDDVEVLDFAGPFEVFSVAGLGRDPRPFRVVLAARSLGPVRARNGLRILPDLAIDDTREGELLLVPGGMGTRGLLDDRRVLDWIRDRADAAEMVLSVCTGALLLGKAGLLDGLEATTHHLRFDLLKAAAPRAVVRRDRRYVESGKVVTSAGISAGIDMSLAVVARLLGAEVASETAAYMEYRWNPLET